MSSHPPALQNEQCKTGGVYGFLVDSNAGPIPSVRPVAVFDTIKLDYPEIWVKQEDSFSTEVIRTNSDRNSNYVHAGWSLSAVSTLSPWMESRISNRNQASSEGSWLTKRMVLKRRMISIPSEELRPSPEFEADIRGALSKHSNAERFQGVYKALNRWGDVVPLAFELGASLTITDVEKNAEQGGHWLVQRLLVSGTGRIDIIGGKPQAITGSDITAWMSQPLQPHDWRIIRVLEIMSTINLLDRELQEQLASLHATLLSFGPQVLNATTDTYGGWDDASRALSTISGVIIRYHRRVVGLSAVFMDGSQSNQYGSGCSEDTFELSNGEYISYVIVWNHKDSVRAVQFVTTGGRLSLHYGGIEGTPTILSCEGGVLAGFSGKMINLDKNTIGHIQAIWRHDIVQINSTRGGLCAEYFGGAGGQPFNDWPFFSRSPDSTYISSIEIRCNNECIRGIQVTYAEQLDGRTLVSRAPLRGEHADERHRFELAPGEHIVTVSGAETGVIARLCFITNTGRTSNAFGGNNGESFMCQPRTSYGKSMRLAFIAGKSGSALDGLLLAWVPI
ncbi:Zymogen granule membrane protein 16 [Ceratobasidium sp. UAMH 11750]|nr:Zymogen granule membrane protein 16 [Ceratobasidium sp. UAMH 11750]